MSNIKKKGFLNLNKYRFFFFFWNLINLRSAFFVVGLSFFWPFPFSFAKYGTFIRKKVFSTPIVLKSENLKPNFILSWIAGSIASKIVKDVAKAIVSAGAAILTNKVYLIATISGLSFFVVIINSLSAAKTLSHLKNLKLDNLSTVLI